MIYGPHAAGDRPCFNCSRIGLTTLSPQGLTTRGVQAGGGGGGGGVAADGRYVTTESRDAGVLIITTSTQGRRFKRQGFTLAHLGSAAAQRTVYAGGAVYCTDGTRALTLRNATAPPAAAAPRCAGRAGAGAGPGPGEENLRAPCTGPSGAFAGLSPRTARYSKGRTWPQALIRSCPPVRRVPAAPEVARGNDGRRPGGGHQVSPPQPRDSDLIGDHHSSLGDGKEGKDLAPESNFPQVSDIIDSERRALRNEGSRPRGTLAPFGHLVNLGGISATLNPLSGPASAATSSVKLNPLPLEAIATGSAFWRRGDGQQMQAVALSARTSRNESSSYSWSEDYTGVLGSKTARSSKKTVRYEFGTLHHHDTGLAVGCADGEDGVSTYDGPSSSQGGRWLPTISSSSKTSTQADVSGSNESNLSDSASDLGFEGGAFLRMDTGSLRRLQNTVLNALRELYLEFCGPDQCLSSNQFIACLSALHLIKPSDQNRQSSRSSFNFFPVEDAIQLFLSVGDTLNTGMDFEQFAAAIGYLGEKILRVNKRMHRQVGNARVAQVLTSLSKLVQRYRISEEARQVPASSSNSVRFGDLTDDSVGDLEDESLFPALRSQRPVRAESEGKNAVFQQESPSKANGNLTVSAWRTIPEFDDVLRLGITSCNSVHT